MDFAFLHGGAQGGWVWEGTIEALNRETQGACRAIALDVPGCGAKRGRDTADIGVEGIVDELIGDIEGAGLRDVILVGHSQAGSVMPLIARRRPDLLRRLIYLACSIPLPGQTIMEMMGTGVHGSNPREVGWSSPAKAAGMDENARRFCNDMDADGTTAFLARLGSDMWPMASYRERGWPSGPSPVPASYIVCMADQILPSKWQERFAVRLGAEHVQFIDAGHQAMTSQPDRVAALVVEEADRPIP